jgi:transcriptional regulator with XRE-family HTH domain
MVNVSSSSDREEWRSLGLALMVLRRARGLNLYQLSQASGATTTNLSRYERGKQLPRLDGLTRIMKAIGLPAATLYEMQRFIEELTQGRDRDEDAGGDGTLPPARRQLVSREDALRLAQETGKAVAHVVLAFMELQAGGWAEEKP